MKIERIEGECSCNNCLDREPSSAYKVYFGKGSITTTLTLCVTCVAKLSFSLLEKGREASRLYKGLGETDEHKD